MRDSGKREREQGERVVEDGLPAIAWHYPLVNANLVHKTYAAIHGWFPLKDGYLCGFPNLQPLVQ